MSLAAWKCTVLAAVASVLSGCSEARPLPARPRAAPDATLQSAAVPASRPVTNSSDTVDVTEAPNCTASKLFGKDGAGFDPRGRLLDYAYAGYHAGADPIPDVSGPITSVASFGAKPDDAIDDTSAFRDAIDAASSGVVAIPAGRFVLSERLTVNKGHLVIRGAGVGKTVLTFPKALGDVYELVFDHSGHSNWSFGGAFLTVQGSDKGAVLAQVTSNAARGDTRLVVDSIATIRAGQWVRLLQRDAAGSLLNALYGGKYDGDVSEDLGRQAFRFYSKVAAVAGNSVTLERALPFPVATAWTPRLAVAAPVVTEVGIEDLTLSFAPTPYPGHFKERGFNAIQLKGVQNSWVRRVEILDADYGITLNESQFCTVSDVTLDTDFDRGPLVGHHALNASGSSDLLFTRFDIRKTFVHDLSVDNYAFGTVWSRGRGLDLCMDHHGRAPYGTLWTALDLGAGTRAFESGGAKQRMPHSGAYTTYWNVRASRSIELPPSDFGPFLNFVGVGSVPASAPPPDWFVEPIAPAELCAPDLHAAMVARRR